MNRPDPQRPPAALGYETPPQPIGAGPDRDGGVFLVAAIVFLIVGLALGMLQTWIADATPVAQFVEFAGAAAMLAAGGAAAAAWCCAVLALRRRGPLRNVVWVIVISTFILTAYAVFFLMLLAGS